jgi:acyl dehydratase
MLAAMLSETHIGMLLEPLTVRAEPAQMRVFARATGQTEAIFLDEQVALAAGYRALVAPPTFVHALYALGTDRPFDLFDRLGIRLATTLHGEQSFEYGAPLCAGDRITFAGSVLDVYSRNGGRLDFLVYEQTAVNQLGEQVTRMRTTTVIVNR